MRAHAGQGEGRAQPRAPLGTGHAGGCLQGSAGLEPALTVLPGRRGLPAAGLLL